MLPIYYSITNFSKNYKTEFHNIYSKEFNYFAYLNEYKKSYIDYISDLPYQKIITEENIIYDLLERELYQISNIDLIIEDSVTYEENGIDVGRYLKEVFNDDFENEVFQLYSTKTATSVLKAIKNRNTIEFDAIIQSNEGIIEHPDYNELEDEDDDYDEKLESLEEREFGKRSLWQQRILFKYHLIDLIKSKYIPEFQNIISTIDSEIHLEIEKKKNIEKAFINGEHQLKSDVTDNRDENDTDLLKYLSENFTSTDKRFNDLTKYNQIYRFFNERKDYNIEHRAFKKQVKELFDFDYHDRQIKGETQKHQTQLKNLAVKYKDSRK